VWHEETQATASHAVTYGGRFLVVLDDRETGVVCDYIRSGGDREAFLARFGRAVSAGFDPDRDLNRIGLANQTTMLMSESLSIGEMLKQAVLDRYGAADLPGHFQAFDTICSATQDRQDAVVAMLAETPPDLMIVIGGYNSSNTCNLARICAERCPTFHIADPDCLVSAESIRHRPVGAKAEVETMGWLPATGGVTVGLTSGASTPDNLVGAAVEKLTVFCA
jgi:4-hydroxy-3-methylbut-2-enyl diphosphate reductase